GSEFINAHLLRYCKAERISFTRTRSYRKNDNCFVEQKNYSVVRRAVGYFRYNTEKELEFLNELYQYYRLFVNFFLPVVKLVKKERRGSKVIKSYDKPKTPYERVLECEEIEEIKEGYRESMGKVMEGSQIQGREE
ncbi:MAG: ISNCY family transposase, partial [Dictyoglomus sp.]